MAFVLPFPTLRDFAVLKIAHSFMDLDMSRHTYADKMSESLSKVDKLKIPNRQKCLIREVIKGTHDHLSNFYKSSRVPFDSNPTRQRSPTKYNFNPKLQFDIYGRVDEVSMAKDFLRKSYSDDRCDTNLLALQHSLYVACFYVLLPDIEKILSKILKLCAKDSTIPQLKGPEFQIRTNGKLRLVYTFVGQQGIPMSWNGKIYGFSAVRVSKTRVRITLDKFFYTLELFQLHYWKLVEPSRRILFARNLIHRMTNREGSLVCQVVNIHNFLDPDTRRGIMGKVDVQIGRDIFLCGCFLVWPYQGFFIPALQSLVGSLREQHLQLMGLFKIIVGKLDMIAFEEIMRKFWEVISSEFKSMAPNYYLPDQYFQAMLRELARKNVPMYERVATDLNLPLIYSRNLRKRKSENF